MEEKVQTMKLLELDERLPCNDTNKDLQNKIDEPSSFHKNTVSFHLCHVCVYWINFHILYLIVSFDDLDSFIHKINNFVHCFIFFCL